MHQYYYGGEQASVDAANVDAVWKSKPRALELLNRAFEIYYNACKAIKNIDDFDMRRSLERSLDKLAKSWHFLFYFPGQVSTLVDGFRHLDKYDGRWKDDNARDYNKQGAGIRGNNVRG